MQSWERRNMQSFKKMPDHVMFGKFSEQPAHDDVGVQDVRACPSLHACAHVHASAYCR